MIYLIASASSAFYGIASGLGAVTLLRPLLDAVSPLPPTSIAMLCTMAALCASLINAFFALSQPIPLPQDDLLMLATGSALGGILGDLAASRFTLMLPETAIVLLQNALLLTLVALPLLYFGQLSNRLSPLGFSRMFSFPLALLIGLFASFLAFGAEPLTLMLFIVFFDADHNESAFAALTVSLFAMAGKLLTMLIRLRFALPDADALLFVVPGTIGGALLAMLPGTHSISQRTSESFLRLSVFTSLLNVAAAYLR